MAQQAQCDFLEWSSQSPDLNPVQNLWKELKSKFGERRASKCGDLKRICIKERKKVSNNVSKNLVLSYKKRLEDFWPISNFY